MGKVKNKSNLRWLLQLVLILSCNYAFADDNDIIYEEQFNTEEDFNKWTNTCGNSELTKTWIYYASKGNGQARLLKEANFAHDNWLISPSFNLEAGKMYELSCYVYSGVFNKQESLRITLGTSTDVSTQTTTLLDMASFVRGDATHNTTRFNVEHTGNYNLGLYAYSQVNQGRIEVDSIIIKEISLGAVPGKVSELNVTPAQEGTLSATISFTAPKTKADGTDLNEISSITIYRGESLIKTIENPAPGEKISYLDEEAKQGYNTYNVYCTNADGTSEPESQKTYIGLDVPTAVKGLTAKRNKDLSITLMWEAPDSSVNGGFYSADDIKYNVSLDGETLASTSEKSYTYTPEEKEQRIYEFCIEPEVTFGCGTDTVSNKIISGTPLVPAFAESFTNGGIDNTPWCQDTKTADFKWYITDYSEFDLQPYDNDNGMLVAKADYAFNDEKSRIMTPIFDLSKMTNPVLSFYLYQRKSEDVDEFGSSHDTLRVQVSIDGGEWQDMNDASFTPYANTSGWTRCCIPLHTYEGSNVSFSFLAELNSDWGTHHNVYIDSVAINEAGFTNDLAVRSFNASEKRVNIGETTTFSATIYNHGAYTVGNYDVILYRNDIESQRIKGYSILPTETETYTFKYEAILQDARQNDTVLWKVAIEYNDDEIESNNISEAINWTVRMNEVPAPKSLSALSTDNSITLSWNECSSEAPVEADLAEYTTDDFESYEPFIIDDIGEWTVLDLDGGKTLNSPVIPTAYPHKGEPMAWQVFNTEEAGVVTEDHFDNVFLSHSGKQYLMCPSNDDYYQRNNDWLISPRLDGQPQTVSFYARTPNSASGADWLKVYYSTTDKHPDSFKQLGDKDHIAVWDWWNKGAYAYQLPEGTRYFAIRAVRCFLYCMVDDVTYRPYNGDRAGLTLVGYNIYRNEEKINADVITDNTFTDSTIDKDKENTYNVTAVYEEGESDFSNTVKASCTSSIKGVSTSSDAAFYNISGERISKPMRGINIIKNQDGTTRKVLAK